VRTQHTVIIDARAEADIIRYCLQGISKIVFGSTLLEFGTIQTPHPATGRRSALLWPFCNPFRASAKERGAADS
jgi:hypothetical protein